MKKNLFALVVAVVSMAIYIGDSWRDRILNFNKGDVGIVIATNHNRRLAGKKIVDLYVVFISREGDNRPFELVVTAEQFQSLTAEDTVLGRPGQRIAKAMIAAEPPATPAVDDEDNPTRLDQSSGGVTLPPLDDDKR